MNSHIQYCMVLCTVQAFYEFSGIFYEKRYVLLWKSALPELLMSLVKALFNEISTLSVSVSPKALNSEFCKFNFIFKFAEIFVIEVFPRCHYTADKMLKANFSLFIECVQLALTYTQSLDFLVLLIFPLQVQERC